MKLYDWWDQEKAHRILGQYKQLEIEAGLKMFAIRKKVLEIGTAEGFLLRHLLKHKMIESGTGCDISLNKINRAVLRSQQEGYASQTEFIHVNGDYLPFSMQSFDIVMLPNVLEHLPNLFQVSKLIRHAMHISREGVIIVLPVRDANHRLLRWSQFLDIDHIRGLLRNKNQWIYQTKQFTSLLNTLDIPYIRHKKFNRVFGLLK